MSWLQRVAWTVLVGLAVFAVALLVGGGLYLDTEDISTPAYLVMGFVGAWISLRRPSSPIGWLFLAAASTASLLAWAEAVVGETLAAGGQWEGVAGWALLCTELAWYVSFSLCVVYVPLLFPDGQLSPAWRRVVIGLAVSQGLFLSLAAVTADLEPATGVTVPNPMAFTSPEVGDLVVGVALALLLVGLVLGLVSLVLRHRRAGAVERLQLRWFLTAVAVLPLSIGGAILASSAFPLDSPLQMLVQVMLGLSLMALPMACTVAVLRYRLYAIDRILSRTVSYMMVTVLVVGTYAVVVTSVSTLLGESSTLAVAGATLAAAAVFRPVMRRVQGVVDRRFNRARFDAVHEVDAFATRLRDSVDADATAADLSGVVQRTLQPAAVGTWTKVGQK